MSEPCYKQPKLKLDSTSLSQAASPDPSAGRVAGARCAASMQRLQVHHMQFRSHSGADSEENPDNPVVPHATQGRICPANWRVQPCMS